MRVGLGPRATPPKGQEGDEGPAAAPLLAICVLSLALPPDGSRSPSPALLPSHPNQLGARDLPPPWPPARSPSLILQNNLFMETEKSTNGRSKPLPRIPPPLPTPVPSVFPSQPLQGASTLPSLQGRGPRHKVGRGLPPPGPEGILKDGGGPRSLPGQIRLHRKVGGDYNFLLSHPIRPSVYTRTLCQPGGQVSQTSASLAPSRLEH